MQLQKVNNYEILYAFRDLYFPSYTKLSKSSFVAGQHILALLLCFASLFLCFASILGLNGLIFLLRTLLIEWVCAFFYRKLSDWAIFLWLLLLMFWSITINDTYSRKIKWLLSYLCCTSPAHFYEIGTWIVSLETWKADIPVYSCETVKRGSFNKYGIDVCMYQKASINVVLILETNGLQMMEWRRKKISFNLKVG